MPAQLRRSKPLVLLHPFIQLYVTLQRREKRIAQLSDVSTAHKPEKQLRCSTKVQNKSPAGSGAMKRGEEGYVARKE